MMDEPQSTRRTALQMFSGAALSVAGLSGSVSAEALSTDRPPRVNEQFGGDTEWVVKLEEPSAYDAVSGNTEDTRQQVKEAVANAQANTLQSLRVMDGVTILRPYWITNAILVAVDEAQVDTPGRLEALDDVKAVFANFEFEQPEPVERQEISTLTHDETSYQYGLQQANVSDVWEEFGIQGSGARVAVLDTGVDPDHPDINLSDGGWAQFNAQGSMLDTEPNDPDGHGTHVSGTATGGRASGVHIGVAPGAELYHGKVLNDGGSFAQIAAGIEWAASNEADVINMSLGAPGFFPQLIPAVRNARALDAFVVVSAGNSGAGSTGSPGNYEDSFGIGATDFTESVASFSSGGQVNTSEDWGDAAPNDYPPFYTVPDVAAPGVSVLSALPGGGYGRLSGTSMAAPHTAGVAALAVSANPELTPRRLESLLGLNSVNPVDGGRDIRYGRGIIDAFRSVTDVERAGSIEGTVTGPSGSPIEGLTVDSSYGTSDVTDSDGSYRLPVPEQDVTVSAGGFGLDSGSTTVSVSGSTQQDLSVSNIVDIQLLQGQRPDMAAGPVSSTTKTFDSFTIAAEAANLEEYAVSLGSDSTNITASEITLTVNGQAIQPGDSITFDQPVNGQVSIGVNVSDDTTDGASFTLNHTFVGSGDNISVTTGPTTVLQNPTPPSFDIVNPNFDTVVGQERALETAPIIENSGDLTDTQDIFLIIELAGLRVPFSASTTLSGGEQVENPIGAISFGEFARQSGTQTIQTENDSASSSFDYYAAENELRSISLSDSITAGDSLDPTFEVQNIGELNQAQPIAVILDSEELANPTLATLENVSVEPGTTSTVTLSTETGGIIPGTYTVIGIGQTGPDEETNQVSAQVEIQEPEEPQAPTVVGDSPVTDPDGDGLYEDINGNGEFDIGDIQALFDNLDSDTMQRNSSLFDFNSNGGMDIGDVQALFGEFSNQ